MEKQGLGPCIIAVYADCVTLGSADGAESLLCFAVNEMIVIEAWLLHASPEWQERRTSLSRS